MAFSKEHYVPLRQSLDSADSKIDAINEAEEAFDANCKPRNLSLPTLLLSITIVVLLVINIIQGVGLVRLQSQFFSTTLDGQRQNRDLERRGSIPTKFMSENETEAAQAWDKIEAGHGLVAVDPEWATAHDWPPTMRHPKDSSKVVYVIEAYHEIHCLKFIREHYMALAAGMEPWWHAEHDMHCFDALRQHTMCMADDTLLYTRGHRDAGVNQTRMCRDWDALSQWATDRTACYHDFVPQKGQTRWEKCDGGDDGLPVGSLLE